MVTGIMTKEEVIRMIERNKKLLEKTQVPCDGRDFLNQHHKNSSAYIYMALNELNESIKN